MFAKSIFKFGTIWIIVVVVMIGITGMHQKKTQKLAEQCTAETQYVVSDVDVQTETKRVKRNGKYRTTTETNYKVVFDYEVDNTLFHTVDTFSSNTHSVGEVGTIYYDPANPNVSTFVSLEGMDSYNSSLIKSRVFFGGFLFIMFAIMTVFDSAKKKQRQARIQASQNIFNMH